MTAVTMLNWYSTCSDVRSYFKTDSKTLSNSTVIVTGSNTGIGKITAQQLSFIGANVILACRNLRKAETAISEIRDDPVSKEYKDLKLTPLKLDLSSLKQVKEFVQEFLKVSKEKKWPPLTILVLNAGLISFQKLTQSADGFEETFAVNHLGHFFLTDLLMPELKKTKGSRVVVVSSLGHMGPTFMTKDLTNKQEIISKLAHPTEKDFGPGASYSSSKLCNVMFAKSLHEKYSKDGVYACSLHPGGFMATDVSRGNSFVNFLQKHVFSYMTKTLDQGSATTLYCCLEDPKELQGDFYCDCHKRKPSSKVTPEAAKVLWDVSEELIRSKL